MDSLYKGEQYQLWYMLIVHHVWELWYVQSLDVEANFDARMGISLGYRETYRAFNVIFSKIPLLQERPPK